MGPIHVDPYLRAATLSTQAASWHHITQNYTDELINYGMNVFPISRPSSDVADKLEAGHCTSTFQLSFLVCNLGNLARPMQFGDKKISKKTYTGPCMLAKFFFHNWAHIRVILEAEALQECPILRAEAQEHFINGLHGEYNTHQAIYVTGPRDPTTGTKLRILKEGTNKSCPWTAFEVQFANEHRFDGQIDFSQAELGKKSQERKKVKQLYEDMVSRMRAGEAEDDIQDQIDEQFDALYPTSRGSTMKPNEGCAKRCGKSSWKIIALHTHNSASYGAVAKEAVEMYKFAFENQVELHMLVPIACYDVHLILK